MQLCCWFPALLFASAALAERVGYWTLYNFTLSCDDEGSRCAYHFSVSEETPTAVNSPNVSPCLFTVDGKDGKPANQTDFQGIQCMGNDQYMVNGGWSPDGFVTIVVTNIYENNYAFFAYQTAMLEAGKMVDSQTRPAYKVGTFAGNTGVVMPQKRSGVEWQILNLHQDYDELAGSAELTFAIRDAQGVMTPCTVITEAPQGNDAAVGSFYNKKCIETGFYVSWDYSANFDSAIMTLVRPRDTMQAFFGWYNVASSHSLGNSIGTMALPSDGDMELV